MKSNSILRNSLILAAPLALLLQASAMAQAVAGDDTNTPPVAYADALAFWTTVDFHFPGGSPKDFLRAVDKQYRVDWSSIADIPSEMQNVHVPALRMSRKSMERLLPFRAVRVPQDAPGGGGGGGIGGRGLRGPGGMAAEEPNPLQALIRLYRSLSQARPELGEMLVEGSFAKPSIVIFRPGNPIAPPELKIKAFALRGIPAVEWDKLAAELKGQFEALAQLNHEASANCPASVTINRDSGLLVVLGPESALEVAESLVAAWKDNYQGPPPPPGTK